MTKATRRWIEVTVIAGFLIPLVLPTADKIANLDTAPVTLEKRKLAEFPRWGGGIKSYLAGVDAYFTDNFGFRRRLIKTHNRWKMKVFKRSSSDDVVLGKDGWLFFSGEGTMEYTRRVKQFTAEELTRWRGALEARQELASSRGARYVFVVAPNKEEIYPEFVPDWMKGSSDKRPLHDQLFSSLEGSPLVRLDLRPALARGKADGLVYAVTDTHWNPRGALIGAREILAALRWPQDALDARRFLAGETADEAGDLAGMLGLTDRYREKLPTFVPHDGWAWVQRPIDFRNGMWRKGQEPSETVNPKKTGTALVLCDSFSIGLVPYLGESFGRVVYIWDRRFLREGLDAFKPDVVIDEIVERALVHANPDTLRPENPKPGQPVGDSPPLQPS